MKKLLTLLFIAGTFALTSCGGSETKNEAAAQDSMAAVDAAAKADSMLQTSADTAAKMVADTTKK